MAVAIDLNLRPDQVARPLNRIQDWRLPEGEDLLRMQLDVFQTLSAMAALSELEVPLAVELHADGELDDRVDADEEALFGLLGEAERTLDGYPHRLRIQRVSAQCPGHATELEETRQRALAKVRVLRQRLGFIRSGLDALEEPAWLRHRGQADRVLQ